MKKLILSFFMITILTGCVSEPVKQEEVMTAEVTTQAETIGNIDLDEEIKAYFSYEGLSDYKEYKTDSCFDITTDLYFIDIDDDGVYEMLRCLHFNYPAGGHTVFFYDYVDKQVVLLGKADGGANSARYASYYEKDNNIPQWLINEPVQMYKNKEDGSVKYLTYRIRESGRTLEYYFTEIQICDGNVVSENKDYSAAYCIYDDGAIPIGWTYTLGGKAISEEEFIGYIGTDDKYEIYIPEKPCLYTELDCNDWWNKDINDLNVRIQYEKMVNKAVENVK